MGSQMACRVFKNQQQLKQHSANWQGLIEATASIQIQGMEVIRRLRNIATAHHVSQQLREAFVIISVPTTRIARTVLLFSERE